MTQSEFLVAKFEASLSVNREEKKTVESAAPEEESKAGFSLGAPLSISEKE